MPLGELREIPGDLRRWNEVFRKIQVTPDENTVDDAAIQDNAVTDQKLRDSAGCSVIGRAAATVGDPSDIAAGADDLFLVRRAGALVWGAIEDTDVAAAVSAALAGLGIVSGPFTPTLTNAANLDASTAYAGFYLQLMNVVIYAGKADVDPTAPGVETRLGIELPVASAFANQHDCAGVAFASGIAGQGAAIRADAVNDRAEMVWIAGDISNQPMYYIAIYSVIP